MKKERIQKSINRIRVTIKNAFYSRHHKRNEEGYMLRNHAIELVLTLAETLEVDYDKLEGEFSILVDNCTAGGSDEWNDKRESRSAIAQFLNKTFGIDWAKM